MSLDRSLLRSMMHSPIRNYIIPGVTSWLIGEPSPKGTIRLFQSSRDHQEAVTPHSHRFDFQCWVLDGRVRNRIWTYSSYGGDMFTQTNLVYKGEPGAYERVHIGQSRYEHTDTVHEAGSWYSMKSKQIHSIYFAKGTEVLFLEGPTKESQSLILEPFVDGDTIPTFNIEPWMFKKPEPA
jgi:hypothetical protein